MLNIIETIKVNGGYAANVNGVIHGQFSPWATELDALAAARAIIAGQARHSAPTTKWELEARALFGAR